MMYTMKHRLVELYIFVTLFCEFATHQNNHYIDTEAIKTIKTKPFKIVNSPEIKTNCVPFHIHVLAILV